jgi:hypothetical protein
VAAGADVDETFEDVDVGATVAAGAVVGAAAGAVDAFFFAFLGVLGAVSGSWYWLSPAPSAKAAAGVVASSAAATIEVRVRLDIESLVADGSRDAAVTLAPWPR